MRLLVEVWDQAPGIPVLREAAGDEESGRGLILVNAISEKWGWNPAEGQPGKVVWAEKSLFRGRVGAASSAARNESADGILARVRDALRCL